MPVCAMYNSTSMYIAPVPAPILYVNTIASPSENKHCNNLLKARSSATAASRDIFPRLVVVIQVETVRSVTSPLIVTRLACLPAFRKCRSPWTSLLFVMINVGVTGRSCLFAPGASLGGMGRGCTDLLPYRLLSSPWTSISPGKMVLSMASGSFYVLMSLMACTVLTMVQV